MKRFSKDDWEALRPLLDEALELSTNARPAWLAQQRKSNPTLAAEVEELPARFSRKTIRPRPV